MLSDPPFAHLYSIKPRPIVDFVPIIEIHVLLHRSGIDAREPPDRSGKFAIGRRTILCPQRHPFAPVAIETSTVTIIGAGWIHETCESPFAGPLPIRWQRSGIAIFDGGIWMERALSKQRAYEAKDAANRQKNFHQAPMEVFHGSFASPWPAALACSLRFYRDNS